MAKSELTARNYYDNYESVFNLNLNDMWFNLVWSMHISEGAFDSLKEKPKAQFLVLGSATPSNITYASKIDHYIRPEKAQNDTITIVDQNLYPLSKHAEYLTVVEGTDGWSNEPFVADFDYPHFQLVQGDLRNFPFKENSFDVVISDFTLNFLSYLREMEKAFQDIAALLHQNGVYILSVRGYEILASIQDVTDEPLKKEMETIDLGRFEIQVLPFQTYLKIAQENGFKLIASFVSVNDMYLVLVKI